MEYPWFSQEIILSSHEFNHIYMIYIIYVYTYIYIYLPRPIVCTQKKCVLHHNFRIFTIPLVVFGGFTWGCSSDKWIYNP